jgi:hypothetical protein
MIHQSPAKPRRVLVVGATSGIGEAVCRILADRGWSLGVTGRDAARLQAVADGLRARGGHVEPLLLDAVEFVAAAGCVDRAADALGGPLDGVVICPGWSPPELDRRLPADEIRGVIDANFTSAAIIMSAAAGHLVRAAGDASHAGRFIAVISSVAGERGRPRNFTYGAAKAGLTAYAAGLRGRLHPRGIQVLTVKPGFVDTPMLRSLGIGPSPLVATPDRVAAAIVRAIDRRRDVLYTPWFWRWIMLAVRLIPEPIFKRLRI